MISKKHKIGYKSFRSCQKNAKTKNKKQFCWKIFLKRVLFWTIFLGFIGVALWTLLFSPVMKVQDIRVNSQRLSEEEIISQVRVNIQDKYLGIFPKNNLLLIRNKKLEEDLESNYLSIRGATVERKFPDVLLVEVEERQSHLVWCNGSSCVLVDERAEVFYRLGSNEIEKAKAQYVVVMDQSNREFEMEELTSSPKNIQLYEKLPEFFKQETGLEIEKEFSTSSSMAEEIRAKTKQDWEVYFSTARPIENQMETLKKVLAEKVVPERRNDLEYVDLRIKGKAIFKYKNSDSENSAEGEKQEKEDEEEDKEEE